MHNWLSYYGNGYTAAGWTRAERAQNVDLIASYLASQGWTIYGIAAAIGNMEAESYINPGQWEHSFPVEQTPAVGGFGLVQWTPWTKYSTWAGVGWKTDYDKELYRIQYEVEVDIDAPNTGQWDNRGTAYPISFWEFATADGVQHDVRWLALAFFKNYERGVGGESARQSNAEFWLLYLQNNPPQPWQDDTKKREFKIMFYLKPWWKRI